MGLLLDLWFSFVLFLCVHSSVISSDQDGFLSLSCGGKTSFVDSSSIKWEPDENYTNTGNTTTVTYIADTSSSQVPIRFFPKFPKRNCYRLPIKSTLSSILVRTRFIYQNYDGLAKPPSFYISLETAASTNTINLTNTDPWIEEFIWPVKKEVLSLCLLSIPGAGFPVISTLEVRPIPRGAYSTGLEDFTKQFLRKTYRIDCGSNTSSLRYPSDKFDRIWDADQNFSPSYRSSAFKMQKLFKSSSLKENPPSAVIQTARIPARKEVLAYSLPLNSFGDYYIILYFAGIFPLSPSFDVVINGDVIQSNYTVKSSAISALFIKMRGIKNLDIRLKDINFHPQINGIEVYEIIDIPSESSSTTVSALQVIQQSTGLDLGWEYDPCYPTPWVHIKCEGNLVTSLDLSGMSLRAINPTFSDLLDLKTLDLHNTSLIGEIQNLGSLQDLEKLNLSFNKLTSFGFELENLANLQVLDLQNNSLRGLVPDNLGELKALHLLNLENNELRGALPLSLHKESLEVRTSGNLCLSFTPITCISFPSNRSIETPQVTVFPIKKHHAHNHVFIILGAVGGSLFILTAVSVVLFLYSRRNKTKFAYTGREEIDMRNWLGAKLFTYREIKVATNNFKDVIGRGSFGSVYLGKLPNGKTVAVKVRLDKSQLGAESFVNEVSVLSQIHHQNLVMLEGFCHESKQQILVYEYIPCGSLADNLYGKSRKRITLSWIRRLKIAVDAAKGLDYLHNGSDPRIIHRDVKSSNILLDTDMNAKVCDFGLSKQFSQSDVSHVSTGVKGTVGYIDPEYYSTLQLTEKSDVYSFGVVLLELICGRESLSRSGTPDSFNLVLWAKPYLQAGAFEIVDESLKGTFEVESMRKAVFVAARCVERDACQRPTIAEVLAELKQAYTIQLNYLADT